MIRESNKRLGLSESQEKADHVLTLIERSKSFREWCGKLLRDAIWKENRKQYISQRQAYERFGRANVERWREIGIIAPLRRTKGKLEYNIDTLLRVAASEL